MKMKSEGHAHARSLSHLIHVAEDDAGQPQRRTTAFSDIGGGFLAIAQAFALPPRRLGRSGRGLDGRRRALIDPG